MKKDNYKIGDSLRKYINKEFMKAINKLENKPNNSCIKTDAIIVIKKSDDCYECKCR